VTYTIDALGRHRTQTAAGVTNTYSYAGSSQAVVQIANATTTTNSAIDSLGSRLATKTSGGTFGWLIPDLHGDIAAAMTSAGSAISDAFRYDPYGKLVASATSALPTPWRYQGRLLESSGTDPALYDFGFRSYDPGLGTFTSLDDVAGQALNPATFNRFLYAEGNPETLTDPTGHFATSQATTGGGFDLLGGLGDLVGNATAFTKGVVEGTVGTVVSTVTGTVALAGAAVGAGGCALNSNCRDAAIKSIGSAVQDFAHDPVGHLAAAAADSYNAVTGAVGGAVNTLATDWRTGNFEDLGKITGTVAANFIPVGGVLAKAGGLGRLAADAGRATEEAEVAADAERAAEETAAVARVEDIGADADSCTLTIHCRSSWTPDEVEQAEQKVQDLDSAARRGDLAKTDVSGASRSEAKSFRDNNVVPSGADVDHVLELQVGGQDVSTNLRALSSRVNRSIGSQIRAQLAGVAYGTRISRVFIVAD